MTKKHFEAIAGIVAQYYDPEPFGPQDDWQNETIVTLVNDLADYFGSNKKFNREAFLAICFGG